MEKCKDCTCYDNEDTYEGTGYCSYQMDFVKEDDSCDDFEEGE